MNEENELEKEKSSCDFYNQFIKISINDLRKNGICYVFHKYQVDEILKAFNQPVNVMQNECGYTISIPRNKRNYRRTDI